MSQEYSYQYIPGSIERTRDGWEEFFSRYPALPYSADFVPALGGCFLVLRPQGTVRHRPGLWRHKSAEMLLQEYAQWRESRSPSTIQHGTITVIDDDQSIIKLLKLALENAGYTVNGYGDPRLALELLEETEAPDIMVVDLKMPGMDGREFLRQVRERGFDSRVVIASAFEAHEAQVELAADGALDKPFAPEDLVSLMQSLTSTTARPPVATGVDPD